MKDIKDYTTSELDDMLAGRIDYVEGAASEFEDRSSAINARLDKGPIELTKEEVANGDYKGLHPDYANFVWDDKEGTCVITRDCFVPDNYYDY
jgi:hypothetical protein